MAIATLGAAFGALFAGPISDTIGRKIPIIISDVFYIIGAIFMFFSNSFVTCAVGRFIVGLGIGTSGWTIKLNFSFEKNKI